MSKMFYNAVLVICSLFTTRAVGDFPVSASWFFDGSTTPVVYMRSVMTVPPVPPVEWATLFIWPGLQPLNGPNYFPIDNGVLQPVLTLGPSCAPNPNNLNIDEIRNWWISGQYVNTFGNEPGYSGCYGGDRMAVQPGDKLEMILELLPGSTVWRQSVTVLQTNKTILYSIDMRGQDQAWAEWVVETANGWHSKPPAFTVCDIEIRAKSNAGRLCNYQPRVENQPGASLECAQPVVNGSTCLISYCKFNGGDPAPVVPTSTSAGAKTTTTTTTTTTETTTRPTTTPTETTGPSDPNSTATDSHTPLASIIFLIVSTLVLLII